MEDYSFIYAELHFKKTYGFFNKDIASSLNEWELTISQARKKIEKSYEDFTYFMNLQYEGYDNENIKKAYDWLTRFVKSSDDMEDEIYIGNTIVAVNDVLRDKIVCLSIISTEFYATLEELGENLVNFISLKIRRNKWPTIFQTMILEAMEQEVIIEAIKATNRNLGFESKIGF